MEDSRKATYCNEQTHVYKILLIHIKTREVYVCYLSIFFYITIHYQELLIYPISLSIFLAFYFLY